MLGTTGLPRIHSDLWEGDGANSPESHFQTHEEEEEEEEGDWE